MGLIRCEDCGKMISSQSKACIHCGRTMQGSGQGESKPKPKPQPDPNKQGQGGQGGQGSAFEDKAKDMFSSFQGKAKQMQDKAKDMAEQRQQQKQAEREKAREMDAAGIRYCPRCKSTDLSQPHQKGFSTGKAMVGQMFNRRSGFIAGYSGANKLVFTCLKCGHQFNAIRK